MDNSHEIRKALEQIIKEIITDMENPFQIEGKISYETIDGREYAILTPNDPAKSTIFNLEVPRNPVDDTITEKITPGSKVTASLSSSSNGVVTNYNSLEKIVLAPGDEDYGGVIIVQKCVDKINEVIDKVNELGNWAEGHKVAYNAHTHPTAPSGPISTPSLPYTAPKPGTLNHTTAADLENPALTHQNGVPASANAQSNAEIQAALNAVKVQQAKVNALKKQIADMEKEITSFVVKDQQTLAKFTQLSRSIDNLYKELIQQNNILSIKQKEYENLAIKFKQF